MIKDNKRPWLLLVPTLLIMVIFVVYPIARTFLFSLQRYKLTQPANTKFVGLDNYIKVLTADDFHYALQNSLLIFALLLVLVLSGSLIVALMLNRQSRLSPVLTAAAIIPWSLPPLVNGIIWKFIFLPGYGLMNKILVGAGLLAEPISWTTNRFLLMFVIALVVAWRTVPFCAIILLASLQNIPNDYYEAARIDGCNKRQEFLHITLPLLLPSLVIILVQITIGAINVFDEVISIAGFAYEASTLLVFNYLQAFSFLDFGYGSAITYVIMIISGLAGYLYVKTMTREEG